MEGLDPGVPVGPEQIGRWTQQAKGAKQRGGEDQHGGSSSSGGVGHGERLATLFIDAHETEQLHGRGLPRKTPKEDKVVEAPAQEDEGETSRWGERRQLGNGSHHQPRGDQVKKKSTRALAKGGQSRSLDRSIVDRSVLSHA